MHTQKASKVSVLLGRYEIVVQGRGRKAVGVAADHSPMQLRRSVAKHHRAALVRHAVASRPLREAKVRRAQAGVVANGGGDKRAGVVVSRAALHHRIPDQVVGVGARADAAAAEVGPVRTISAGNLWKNATQIPIIATYSAFSSQAGSLRSPVAKPCRRSTSSTDGKRASVWMA